ncbi:MAG: hypothetical protein ACJAXU_001701, partial [Paracoccaceae bacterium]
PARDRLRQTRFQAGEHIRAPKVRRAMFHVVAQYVVRCSQNKKSGIFNRTGPPVGNDACCDKLMALALRFVGGLPAK